MALILCGKAGCINYLNGICKTHAEQPALSPDGRCSGYRKRRECKTREFSPGDVVLRIYDAGPNRLGTVLREEAAPKGFVRYWVRRDDTGDELDYFGDELILAATPESELPYWIQEG